MSFLRASPAFRSLARSYATAAPKTAQVSRYIVLAHSLAGDGQDRISDVELHQEEDGKKEHLTDWVDFLSFPSLLV